MLLCVWSISFWPAGMYSTGLKVLFTDAGHTLPNATLHMEWNAMHAAEAALALNHQAACCDLLKHDISIHIYHVS